MKNELPHSNQDRTQNEPSLDARFATRPELRRRRLGIADRIDQAVAEGGTAHGQGRGGQRCGMRGVECVEGVELRGFLSGWGGRYGWGFGELDGVGRGGQDGEANPKNMPLGTGGRFGRFGRGRAVGVLWLLAFFIQWEGWAQGAAALPIGGFLNAEGRFTVLFSPTPGSYYILLKGATVTAVNEPVRVVLEAPADNLLSDTEAASGAAAFYRLQQVPVEAPLDVDGDGIDDVYELEHPGVLSALDGADAGLDPDGNGRTHLEEYQLATQPLTTIAEMSPGNGEAGVSVTRETIVRFSAALAANTAIDTGRFYAGFGGRKLLGRVELASDRRTATLFYQEPIPGSTRIYGAFDGNGLTDELGRPIDADADGVPGGTLQFSFDTLSTTPVYGTAVIGRVFASEPKAAQAGGAVGETPTATGGTPVLPMPRRMLSALAQSYLPAQATAFTNLPLAGVTITVDGAEETIRTTTDAEGRFVLTNCPSGRFFVHIDGRTCATGIQNPQRPWNQRDYYPVVGKAWEATAGYTNNLPKQHRGNLSAAGAPGDAATAEHHGGNDDRLHAANGGGASRTGGGGNLHAAEQHGAGEREPGRHGGHDARAV